MKISFRDALAGEYRHEICAVSHRWETPDMPDTQGAQIEKVHTVSYWGPVKVVSNLDLGPRLSSMLTQMAAPPTALSGVGIGLRRWRAGGSRAMGRCRRRTGAAALPPVGLGLTSREEPLDVKNSLEAIAPAPTTTPRYAVVRHLLPGGRHE